MSTAQSPFRVSRPSTGFEELLRRVLTEVQITPFRVALIYLVFGFGALYVSDVLLVRYVSEPLLTGLQAVKGGIEVGATAILIFGLTRWSEYSLEERNQRLARQREELQVLHRVFRHNLRNDLNVIHGYTSLIKNQVDPDQTHEWCQKVINGVEDLMGYAARADQIQRITDHDDASPDSIDLSLVIPRIITQHPAVHDQATISTQLPATAPVAANHMLGDALTELVTHLITHGPASPKIHIAVEPDRGPLGMTTITITEPDTTIPERVITILEDAQEDDLHHLDGLDLWFVYWTIMESNGTIDIDSSATGTTITIRLPHASLNPLGGT